MTAAAFAGPGAVARPSWRVMNLSGLLTQTARRLPDDLALVHGELRMSWAELEAQVASLAAGLRALGLKPGERVLVHSKNCAEMAVAMFATFRAGGVYAPTNFRLTPGEVVYLAQMSDARIFLCHADFPAHAEAVRADAPGLANVLRIGAAGEDGLDVLIARHRGEPAPPAPVSYDDPCWFFFTSGTTGRSKAATLTHGQMAFIVTNHLADLMPGLTEADASLVIAPLSHGAGVHMLSQVARGAVSVLPISERFDVAEIWRLIAEWRVSNMFTVPTILKMLVEDPAAETAAETADASSLRHVIYAGAPMYRADQQRILRRLGRVIVQYFGLGEVTGCITVLPPRLHDPEDGPAAHVGSCGIPRTGVEISIQSEDGRALGPDETGEICVIGPAVFAGYHDNPEANAKSFRDGWFRTGDLGHMDAAGFLHITGRASDMFISGGSNIYPLEIEERILAHPDIVEAAVLGVPDPKWGEIGVAVCVARPGAVVTEDALRAWLDGRIARYKIPARVHFWEALPKSGYGKMPKRMIRDEMAARGLLPDAWAMRSVRQPGPAPAERVAACAVATAPLRLTFPAGASLCDALAEALAARGFEGAALRFAAGALGPFAYVTPALSPEAVQAAFYSPTLRPETPARLLAGALTAGWKAGAPFFHAHALWTDAEGRRACGHILPEETRLAAPTTLEGVGFRGARFEARPDPETGFALFTPVPSAPPERTDALALRLRPNQDLIGALEALCAAQGWARARLHGGVGSVIGARFAGGRGDTDAFATELLLTRAEIDPCGESHVEGALVDLEGAIASGRLLRGENPILMTLEAVLAPA